jgi:hypothetical protein
MVSKWCCVSSCANGAVGFPRYFSRLICTVLPEYLKLVVHTAVICFDFSNVCSYELGEKSRGTALWVKMKPEYGDQTEDLDMLILGKCICLLPLLYHRTNALKHWFRISRTSIYYAPALTGRAF